MFCGKTTDVTRCKLKRRLVVTSLAKGIERIIDIPGWSLKLVRGVFMRPYVTWQSRWGAGWPKLGCDSRLFPQATLTRLRDQFAQAQADMRRGFSGSVRARRSKYAMNGWLVSLSRVAA